MQLVEKNAHETNRHKGSVAEFQKQNNVKYGSEEAKNIANELNKPCEN